MWAPIIFFTLSTFIGPPLLYSMLSIKSFYYFSASLSPFVKVNCLHAKTAIVKSNPAIQSYPHGDAHEYSTHS